MRRTSIPNPGDSHGHGLRDRKKHGESRGVQLKMLDLCLWNYEMVILCHVEIYVHGQIDDIDDRCQRFGDALVRILEKVYHVDVFYFWQLEKSQPPGAMFLDRDELMSGSLGTAACSRASCSIVSRIVQHRVPRLYMMTRGTVVVFDVLLVFCLMFCFQCIPGHSMGFPAVLGAFRQKVVIDFLVSIHARNARWIDGSRSCHPHAVGSDHRRSGILSYLVVCRFESLKGWGSQDCWLICSDSKVLQQMSFSFWAGALKTCDSI